MVHNTWISFNCVAHYQYFSDLLVKHAGCNWGRGGGGGSEWEMTSYLTVHQ